MSTLMNNNSNNLNRPKLPPVSIKFNHSQKKSLSIDYQIYDGEQLILPAINQIISKKYSDSSETNNNDIPYSNDTFNTIDISLNSHDHECNSYLITSSEKEKVTKYELGVENENKDNVSQSDNLPNLKLVQNVFSPKVKQAKINNLTKLSLFVTDDSNNLKMEESIAIIAENKVNNKKPKFDSKVAQLRSKSDPVVDQVQLAITQHMPKIVTRSNSITQASDESMNNGGIELNHFNEYIIDSSSSNNVYDSVTSVLTNNSISNSADSTNQDTNIKRYSKSKTEYILENFIKTENNYIKGLKYLNKDYRGCFMKNDIELVFCDEIFYMVNEIHDIHQDFFSKIQHLKIHDTSQEESHFEIDDFSTSLIEFLKKPELRDFYMKFAKNYNNSRELINQINSDKVNFSKLLETVSKEKCERLTINDLLITPIQRIPRYVLILADIQKSLQPHQPELFVIKQAVDLAKNLASKVDSFNSNESMLLMNKRMDLYTIANQVEGIGIDFVASNRHLVRQDIVALIVDNSRKKNCTLFLLSDSLLCVTNKRKTSNPNFTKRNSFNLFSSSNQSDYILKYKYLWKISLRDLEIIENSAEKSQNELNKKVSILREDLKSLDNIRVITDHLMIPKANIENVIDDAIQYTLKEIQDSNQLISSALSNMSRINLKDKKNKQIISMIFLGPEIKSSWENFFKESQKLNLLSNELIFTDFKSIYNLDQVNGKILFYNCVNLPSSVKESNINENLAFYLLIGWIAEGDSANRISIFYMHQDSKFSLIKTIVVDTVVMRNMAIYSHSNMNMSESSNDYNFEKMSISSTKSDQSLNNKNIQIQDPIKDPQCKWNIAILVAANNDVNVILLDQQWTTIFTQKVSLNTSIVSFLCKNDSIICGSSSGELFVIYPTKSNDYTWLTNIKKHLTLGDSPIDHIVEAPCNRFWTTHSSYISVIKGNSQINEITIKVSEDLYQKVRTINRKDNCICLVMDNSTLIKIFNAVSVSLLIEVDIMGPISYSLTECHPLIKSHKLQSLLVNCMNITNNVLWVGTTSGIIVVVQLPEITPVTMVINKELLTTAISQSHIGPINYISSTTNQSDIMKDESYKKSINIIISCGDGFTINNFDPHNIEKSSFNGESDHKPHILIWECN